MSLFDTKTPEIQVANFFTDRYNRNNNTAYKAKRNTNKSNTNEDDIDCIMTSGESIINLQMVSYDIGSFDAYIYSKKAYKSGEIIGGDLKFIESIIDAIEKKSKKYSDSQKNNLVLLVWSNNCPYDFNTGFLQESLQGVCEKSKFKSIYCIKLPDNDNGNIIPLH